jgi:hypothetical protein
MLGIYFMLISNRLKKQYVIETDIGINPLEVSLHCNFVGAKHSKTLQSI